MRCDGYRAIEVYEMAKQYLHSHGFSGRNTLARIPLNPSMFTESDLLREAAWVILCSGFREAVIRRMFDFISLCFCDWEIC